MATAFDITPERRASQLHFLYRQLFVTPPPVQKGDGTLGGKTAIVTGGNGGIGLETARLLLGLGCEVILAVRDESKGQSGRRMLLAEYEHLESTSIHVWALDLADYDSITAFAQRCQRLEKLDVVILNAGLYKATESFHGSTGYEEGVQVNYLSNMLLMLLLLPVMKEKRRGDRPGHICLVSSDTAAWSRFEERSTNPFLSAFKRKMMPSFDSNDRYGTTKLLGQLFLSELARRVPSSVVTLSCANPGFCRGSGLGREVSGPFLLVLKMQYKLLGRSPAVGARVLVHAIATLGERAHGEYIEDAKIQPMAPIVYKPEGISLAKKLYEETLEEFALAGLGQIVHLS
ncbi:hypothetical protein GGS20DRAFT_523942 [Poronia punctata]|nr:hypothetical protein GGS20DRAFT_523942 [Poronia punctata]